MGLINWFRGKFCTNKGGHVPKLRYRGMTVKGYVCKICGYRWYEKRYKV